MNPAVADVYDYDTNECLEGFPSEPLVEASLAADLTGAVPAFFDSNEGLWQYVLPEDVDQCRKHWGETVRIVYIMEGT